MTGQYASIWKDDAVLALAELAAKFVDRFVVADREKWEAQKHIDREIWLRAGELGLLCCSIPEQYGGGGGTIAHDLAVVEAHARSGDAAWGVMVHSGIVAHYILAYGTEEQKQRWLPKLATGEMIAAIAMTEPGTGSDLRSVQTKAVRHGDEYVIDGSKTFVSNGFLADLTVVVAKTDPQAGTRGISLIVVESRDCPGYARGRILDKVGRAGADTSELFLDGVAVPASNLLGEVEGQGFTQLMTQLGQERLFIAITAVAAMEAAVVHTVDYVKQRSLFGKTLFDYQNTKFTLAECATLSHVARVFVDSCVERHLAGTLDAATAAMAKYWLTEQQVKLIDSCVQLFGGYGYMREYPIARLYADARVQMVWGGSNETMKDIIGRGL